MQYEVRKKVDGKWYYEGRGDINYIKRIVLFLGSCGLKADDISIIFKEEK